MYQNAHTLRCYDKHKIYARSVLCLSKVCNAAVEGKVVKRAPKSSRLTCCSINLREEYLKVG